MNKFLIPLLMLMTLSLSGCIYDPFYWDHRGGGWHGDGWRHGDDGWRGGHHDD